MSGRAASGAGPRVIEVCRVLWNGGVQRVAIAQTEGLRARGIPCDLLFLRSVPGVAYPLPEGTVVLAQDGEGRSSLAADLARAITDRFAKHRGQDASVDLDLLWKARDRIAAYDVAIYNDQYGGLLGVWLRLTRRRPFVLMFHEFYPRVPRGPLSRALGFVADLIDAIGILVAPAIVTSSARVQERIERIVPGRSFLARLGAPAPEPPVPVGVRGRRVVFSITVWDRGRHPELFLELARALPEFDFVLAGIWADPAHLAEFRARMEGLSNLHVLGGISEPERRRRQRDALLYLRLGYDESGPGMGGMEALSAGSIVIANRGLGISESLDSGINGFVVERPDSPCVVAQLREIDAMLPERLESISAAARQLAAATSWTAHIAELERALDRALGRPSGTTVGASRPESSPTPSPRSRVP